MAIVVTEAFDSRSFDAAIYDDSSIELKYNVTGSNDESAVLGALAINVPATYSDLTLQNISCEPEYVDDTGGVWRAVATYGEFAEKPIAKTGESEFSFDTSGGTTHITQSLSTAGSFGAAGFPAPDFKGSIGVIAKDEIEGADIITPTYSFSESHFIANANITGAYKATLYDLTGTVNAVPFRGFNPGEVLFLGARGSGRSATDWKIDFSFSASKNVAGLMVGDIGPITKLGWQYMWIRYEKETDYTAKTTVMVPGSVHVENVYERTDFRRLGLGV